MMEWTRDAIAEKYLETIPYALYPVQEEALLAWFSSEQGVMVCAPTGTGKTLIAEAAVYEALLTGKRTYYTTPLIALTDQKFRELQASAERWGFSADDVGLVTGNHKVNPDAKVLVVVAEILFNRLLHPEDFDDFQDVHSVVMDEFHNFNDPERGIVWEFSLALLPKHVRLLLLSATVGNAVQFANWLDFEHGHRLEVVQSHERKVPLVFQWVGDQLLVEQIQLMCLGSEEERMTPALVFCFNREECWRVAEEIRGKELVTPEVKSRLVAELARFDWSQGAGPKLKQLLIRGVGVHHAGILPKYRRIVEYLFQQKLLAVCTCTETLSAGINLPARSVVLPSIMKGPAGKQTMLESGTAHQIFGRAGRPQFDTQGHVFALAHEDDVQILRWQEKFNRLPADSKDPKILAEKKALKRKQPKRNPNLQYWTEQQFLKLRNAPAGNLESRGLVPWRMLSFMLRVSPEVEKLRELVKKRLLFGRRQENAQKDLERMLGTLWSAGYVQLQPEPPAEWFPSLPRPDRDPETVNVPLMSGAESFPNEMGSVISEEEEDSRSEKTEERILRIETDSSAKGTPSLEMWKRTRSSEGPAINVPKAAKKHVAKPKQTGFGAGLFDELEEDGNAEFPSKAEPEKTAPRIISAFDSRKKNETEAPQETGMEISSFRAEKSNSGFGAGLLDEPDVPDTGAASAADLLSGLTFGGGIQNASAKKTSGSSGSPESSEAEKTVSPAPSKSAAGLLSGLTFGGGVQKSASKKGPAVQNPVPAPAQNTAPSKISESVPSALQPSLLKKQAENASEKNIPEPKSEKAWVFVDGAAVLASSVEKKPEEEKPLYIPQLAIPTETMDGMAKLRGVHPIFGTWLLNYLPHADRKERLQAFESLLELPYSLGPSIRVPHQDELPRGRLACGYLDARLLDLGLAVEAELVSMSPQERKERREAGLDPIYALTFAEKLYRLFQHECPLVADLKVWPCWVAGEVLRFNGKFNAYISAKGLQKQEGMVFRHLLRLILLLGEFMELELPSGNSDEWKNDLSDLIEVLTKACEAADPSGTRQMLEEGLR